MPPATTVAAFVAFRVEILGCQLPPQALGRAAAAGSGCSCSASVVGRAAARPAVESGRPARRLRWSGDELSLQTRR
jgi:hypothetical protein